MTAPEDSKKAPDPQPQSDAEVEAKLRALSRRGFAIAGVAVAGTFIVWRWLLRATEDGGLAWPLRRALETNEHISQALFSRRLQAPTFSPTDVEPLRENGMYGLRDPEFQPQDWQLAVTGMAAGSAALDLAAVRTLPRTEMAAEFKCIEGWSMVVHWAGVRFADFARAYPPPTRSGQPFDPARTDDAPPYVALETPDGEYYVGLDTASALHPQTLLAWELNGEPLSPVHGAPLRLVIPVKYGIKAIKRIGAIAWTDQRPDDYWAERGYDWFAGL
jgi:DMSO/TMAO reductase YedYZ molybdopterin-dependent catalytic subunit